MNKREKKKTRRYESLKWKIKARWTFCWAAEIDMKSCWMPSPPCFIVETLEISEISLDFSIEPSLFDKVFFFFEFTIEEKCIFHYIVVNLQVI
jgi:hypothetical protein